MEHARLVLHRPRGVGLACGRARVGRRTLRGPVPGIDLELTGVGGIVQPTVVARAGANVTAVRLRVEGASGLALRDGALHAQTALGDVALPLLAVPGAAPARPRLAGNVVSAPFGVPGPRRSGFHGAVRGLFYSPPLATTRERRGKRHRRRRDGAAYVTGRQRPATSRDAGRHSEEVRGLHGLQRRLRREA